MLESTMVRVYQRTVLRMSLPYSYESKFVVNLFVIIGPPFLKSQKFTVAPTFVEVIG